MCASLTGDFLNSLLWEWMGAGVPPGLQNRLRMGGSRPGEFDSHTLSPENFPTEHGSAGKFFYEKQEKGKNWYAAGTRRIE